MRRPVSSRPRRALLFLALSVSGACLTRTYHNAIEVKGGSTIEEKLRFAKSIVTEERLARLKAQVKERLPGTTDQQLAGLGLRWNQTQFQSLTGKGSGTIVTVVVAIQYDSSFDPKPVIEAATAILEPEINPPLAAP